GVETVTPSVTIADNATTPTSATATVTGAGSTTITASISPTTPHLHRFNADGQIVETWNLTDSLAIMQQLGLVPHR
ncbi:MAG: hypothetical protein HYZ40_15775, partial [Rhodospirillales bacterium]|nr:hypothetical protein [Rhodospirillales bacterium]